MENIFQFRHLFVCLHRIFFFIFWQSSNCFLLFALYILGVFYFDTFNHCDIQLTFESDGVFYCLLVLLFYFYVRSFCCFFFVPDIPFVTNYNVQEHNRNERFLFPSILFHRNPCYKQGNRKRRFTLNQQDWFHSMFFSQLNSLMTKEKHTHTLCSLLYSATQMNGVNERG